MLSGVFSTGLSYRGTSLDTSPLRINMRIVRGLGDNFTARGKDTIIPGLPGRVARNRVRDVLVIEAAGFIMGAGADEDAQRADFRDIVDALRSLMDPTEAVDDLVATLEDGTTRTISARAINIVWGDDNIPSFRTLSCEWEAVGDDWAADGS